MEKKYKLTDETITFGFTTLHRIEALRSFGNVKKGDKGGFIENKDNLSHEGNSWIYNEAKVLNKAKVLDNVEVRDYAIVEGCTEISNNCLIKGHAFISDSAKICERTVVKDYARVTNNVTIGGLSSIRDNAQIYGNAKLKECQVSGRVKVGDNVTVFNVILGEVGKFIGNAIISSEKDFIIFKNWWSSGRYFTWTRSNNMWSVGCFYGTGEELIEKAYEDSALSGREYERIVKYVESILDESM